MPITTMRLPKEKMCTFYHATNKPLNEGEHFSTNDFDGETTRDHANRSEQDKEINYQMDKIRPQGVLSRIKSIFLFDNLQFCKQYACSMNYKYIYEVLPVDSCNGPYPMCLVNTIKDCCQKQRKMVIDEYWHPKNQWNINEYLTSEIKIIKNISYNFSDVLAKYSEDLEKAKKMFMSIEPETNFESGRHLDLFNNI